MISGSVEPQLSLIACDTMACSVTAMSDCTSSTTCVTNIESCNFKEQIHKHYDDSVVVVSQMLFSTHSLKEFSLHVLRGWYPNQGLESENHPEGQREVVHVVLILALCIAITGRELPVKDPTTTRSKCYALTCKIQHVA